MEPATPAEIEGAQHMIDTERIPAHERDIYDWRVLEAQAKRARIEIDYWRGLASGNEVQRADTELQRALTVQESRTLNEHTVVAGGLAVTARELRHPEYKQHQELTEAEGAALGGGSYGAPWRPAALRAARGLLPKMGISFLTGGQALAEGCYEVTACDKEGYAIARLLIIVD
jgi:hypothetical protein